MDDVSAVTALRTPDEANRRGVRVQSRCFCAGWRGAAPEFLTNRAEDENPPARNENTRRPDTHRAPPDERGTNQRTDARPQELVVEIRHRCLTPGQQRTDASEQQEESAQSAPSTG